MASRLTSRKKKVALLALRAAWGSGGSDEGVSFCAGSTGVVLRALMSFGEVNEMHRVSTKDKLRTFFSAL